MSDLQHPRRFWFVTLGCQMNRHDSARMAESLRAAGLEPAAGPADADLCVVNTCCVREKAEHKARSAVGRLAAWKARRAGRRVVVAGCAAERRGAGWVEDFPHVDAVLGPDRLGELPGIALDPRAADLPRVATGFPAEGPGDYLVARPDRGRPGPTAFVPVSKGCGESCTFCIVPAVRGPLRLRRPEEVEAEAAGLAAAGVREVTLIGQAVNDYRCDGVGFGELLRRVGAVPGLLRLRYTSPHPRFVDEETARAHAETAALCEHVHLPVQSGSDEVLRRMGRRYGRDDYRRAIDRLRGARADLTFGTDVIVGFPGETEAQFEETVALVREVGFVQVFSFAYSPRPGTAAARWPDDVPAAEKARRLRRLQRVAEEIAGAWRRGRVGVVEEVLLEGPSDRAGGTWQGRTRHNDVVHVRLVEGFVPEPGARVRVTIEEARPHCLAGVPAEAS